MFTPMPDALQNKSGALPSRSRFVVFALSALLTLFFIWLLGFLLADINRFPGPQLSTFEERLIPAAAVNARDALLTEERALKTKIRRQNEIQDSLQTSMTNAEAALSKIEDLQRLSSDRGVAPSAVDVRALERARRSFYAAQEKFEAANNAIAALRAEQYELAPKLTHARAALKNFQDEAKRAYEIEWRAHRLKLAVAKLALVVPLLLALAWWVRRNRGHRYQPIYIAALTATFWKVCEVMHAHFPSKFFKYIAILAAIGLLVALLVWVIRSLAAQQMKAQQKLAAQQLEAEQKHMRRAYENHRCPLCDFPIMRGAFAQAVWTSDGPRLPREVPNAPPSSRYTCPACGAALFDACGACGEITHALFSFCSACGHENARADT